MGIVQNGKKESSSNSIDINSLFCENDCTTAILMSFCSNFLEQLILVILNKCFTTFTAKKKKKLSNAS
jgi:hypothetical protein